MENIGGEISMEFHGNRCPNPPWRYFPWKSMEKFPWNSMEIDVLILHGIPWIFFTWVITIGGVIDSILMHINKGNPPFARESKGNPPSRLNSNET